METLTLTELSTKIQSIINNAFHFQTFLVLGEINKVYIDPRSSHCYLDLVDTDQFGKIITKLKGIIWSSEITYVQAKLRAAGIELKAGLKTIFTVSVSYHIAYGVSLKIVEIDINYIKGALEIKKEQIRAKLKEENLYGRNRSLNLPLLIKNIAVIGAKGSAGLSDFYKTLSANQNKFRFNVTLFNCFVQGVNAKTDILKNLRYLCKCSGEFDIIVLLRGGGSASDLEVFNDYDLASYICKLPIPVLIGIGHSTDSVILDEVAFMSAITPTHLANTINEHTNTVYANIQSMQDSIFKSSTDILQNIRTNIRSEVINVQQSKHKLTILAASLEKHFRLFSYTKELISQMKQKVNDCKDIVLNIRHKLKGIETQLLLTHNTISGTMKNRIEVKKFQINEMTNNIRIDSRHKIANNNNKMIFLNNTISERSSSALKAINKNFLNMTERIEDRNPENLINRGYSLTLYKGKTLKKTTQTEINEIITTIISDGKIESKISNIRRLNDNGN